MSLTPTIGAASSRSSHGRTGYGPIVRPRYWRRRRLATQSSETPVGIPESVEDACWVDDPGGRPLDGVGVGVDAAAAAGEGTEAGGGMFEVPASGTGPRR